MGVHGSTGPQDSSTVAFANEPRIATVGRWWPATMQMFTKPANIIILFACGITVSINIPTPSKPHVLKTFPEGLAVE